MPSAVHTLRTIFGVFLDALTFIKLCFRCPSPKFVASLNIDSFSTSREIGLLMLNAIVIAIRFIILVLSGHKQVALENAALRQQFGRIQTLCQATPIAQSRPNVLGCAEDDLEGLEVGASDRSARHSHLLAPQSVQTVLASIVAIKASRPSAS